ncbi:MAG: exodeoxyribonuclease III, partial [Verrucomicrobiales bacterium]
MKMLSWNVNGLRAAQKHGFLDVISKRNPDVICLQETRATPDVVDLGFIDEHYHALWNCAEKKGYSGTAVFTREKPLSHRLGIGSRMHDREGRVITLEYPDFHLVNVYTPNARRELARLDYRQKWDRAFLSYLKRLEKKKPVVFCGDLNVAHQEIDLANPKSNRRNAGFTDQERAGFGRILEAGFLDSFREFESGPEHYSWWSYRSGARARNIGWRIDYWLVSEKLRSRMKASRILPQIMGSDHCPVEL